MIEDNDNDLLAELNGEAATPEEAKELANAKKEATVDPLAVLPKKKRSAAAAAEEKAAVEAAKKGASVRGYAVTVEGEYLVASKDVAGKKNKLPYSLTVNVRELEGALSTIKNKLLDKMLRMKYPGYLTYATHEIVDARPLTTDTPPAANVAYMTWDQLVALIREERMPISVSAYDDGDVKNLRAAVVDFRVNPTDFNLREERRLASLREDKELAALNDIPSAATASSVSSAAPKK
jgi:hypothetical protein